MLASKHCISSVLAQRCQPETAGNRAAVRKRVLGGTGRERKIRLRPALLGLFERKEIVHLKRNPSRRSIVPHRCPASLNQSRAGAPRGARGLFLQRKTPRAERGAFLICFFFPSCLFFRFSLFFETPRLRFKV